MMETYHQYKGYGVRYYQVSGTTHVEDNGHPIKAFKWCGEITGRECAHTYIDRLEIMEVDNAN